jgi:hypothetical protein
MKMNKLVAVTLMVDVVADNNEALLGAMRDLQSYPIYIDISGRGWRAKTQDKKSRVRVAQGPR